MCVLIKISLVCRSCHFAFCGLTFLYFTIRLWKTYESRLNCRADCSCFAVGSILSRRITMNSNTHSLVDIFRKEKAKDKPYTNLDWSPEVGWMVYWITIMATAVVAPLPNCNGLSIFFFLTLVMLKGRSWHMGSPKSPLLLPTPVALCATPLSSKSDECQWEQYLFSKLCVDNVLFFYLLFLVI